MSICRIPVSLEYTKRKYGADRSISVQSEESGCGALDTQEWRLESLSVEHYVRDNFDIVEVEESRVVGYVEVEPETLEWEFDPEGLEEVS